MLLGGSTAALSTLFNVRTAVSFLVFSLLYTPCVAAIASVKRELGGKWALIVVISPVRRGMAGGLRGYISSLRCCKEREL